MLFLTISTSKSGPTLVYSHVLTLIILLVFTFQFFHAHIEIFKYLHILSRIFRSQTSNTMERWKTRGGKSQRGEEKKEDERRERLRRKKRQVREKVGKVAIHCVFPMICGSGGSRSRLAKAAGAEPSGQMRDEKCKIPHSTLEHFWTFGS